MPYTNQIELSCFCLISRYIASSPLVEGGKEQFFRTFGIKGWITSGGDQNSHVELGDSVLIENGGQLSCNFMHKMFTSGITGPDFHLQQADFTLLVI